MVVDFDYNTNNGNVTRFRCTNNSPHPAYFRVLQDDCAGNLTQVYEKTSPAHQVTT